MPALIIYTAETCSPPSTPLREMSRRTHGVELWRYQYHHDTELGRVVVNSWTPMHYGALPLHLLPAELAGLPVYHYRWPVGDCGKFPNTDGCFMEPVPY